MYSHTRYFQINMTHSSNAIKLYWQAFQQCLEVIWQAISRLCATLRLKVWRNGIKTPYVVVDLRLHFFISSLIISPSLKRKIFKVLWNKDRNYSIGLLKIRITTTVYPENKLLFLSFIECWWYDTVTTLLYLDTWQKAPSWSISTLMDIV